MDPRGDRKGAHLKSSVLTDAELRELYRTRFSDDDRAQKMKLWEILVRDVFQKWIRAEDAVLDLGCGFGEFLNHVRCARKISVDLNPDSPRLLEPGVEFHAGGVSELPFLAEGSVDVVFTSNVMEHLPGKGDVERMLREYWSQPNTKQLNIRIPATAKSMIERLARRKTVEVSTLVRMWVIESMRREALQP